MKLFSWGSDPEPEPDTQQSAPEPDRLERLEQTVGSLTENLNRYFERQAAPQPAPQQPQQPAAQQLPPIEDLSDDEFAEALEEGGAVAAAAVNKRMAAQAERIRREQILPLQQSGLAAIDQLTMQAAVADMPWYTKDATIKAQVDEELAKLPAEFRVQRETKQQVYNWVVGRNASRIEELIRSEMQSTPEPTSARGRTTRAMRPTMNPQDTPDLPPEQVFGEGGMAALREKGYDPDSFVAGLPPDVHRTVDTQTGTRQNRRVNYPNFKGYVDSARDAAARFRVQQARYLGRS